MKEAMKEYFDSEFKQTERWLKSEWCKTPKDRMDSVWYATQRCLGVAQFVQTCPNGLTFEEIETPYEEVRKKLENLLETY